MSIARALFVSYALLVLYLCLYPWSFSAQPVQALWSWQLPTGRTLVVDAVLNLGLFVPFGLLAALSLSRLRYFLAIPLTGFFFSGLVEWFQIYLPTRDSSAWDILYNTFGALLGAGIGAFLRIHSVKMSKHLRVTQASTVPLLLLCLFAGGQLFPFIPRIRLPHLRSSIRAFSEIPDSLALATAFVSFLMAGYWVAQLTAGHALGRWRLGLLAGFLAVRPLFPGGVHTGLAIFAAALGALCAEVLSRRFPSRWLAPLLLAYLVLRQLHPFTWIPDAQVIYWLPFESILQLNTERGIRILLEKCFVYGSVIAMLAVRWNSYFRATMACSLILILGELAQQWIAGRTPDTLDPSITVALGLLLALLPRITGTGKHQTSAALLPVDARALPERIRSINP